MKQVTQNRFLRIAQQTFTVAVCSALSFSALPAQDVVAIRNATIRTQGKDGVIANGTVLIRNGKIAEVGPKVDIPIVAQVIDGKGKTVTPGFVSIFYPVSTQRDSSGGDGSRVVTVQGRTFVIPGRSPAASTSFVKVADILNRDSVEWKGPLRAGVTTMNLVTAGYSQAAVASPSEDKQTSKVIEPNGRVVVTVTNSTQSLDLLRNNLMAPSRSVPPGIPPNMAAMMAARGMRPPGSGTPPGTPTGATPPTGATSEQANASTPELTPEQKLWSEVREGNSPLFVVVNNSATILHVLQVFQEHPKVKAIWVVNGADAYQSLAEFPKETTRLVLPPAIDFVPNSRDKMNVPAIAAERKLPFVLSFGTRTEESQLAPTFALAMLVKTGLSEDSAMKSVTLGPAEFLGLEKTIGSIEVGKVANLILFDGSPFEATTAINNVFLEGRPVYED
jgi:imidazolonepropionase-like amidohydrolase